MTSGDAKVGPGSSGSGPTFDPARLRTALAALTDWSSPSTYESTRVHHGYARAVLVHSGFWLPDADPFRFVLDEFGPVHDVWVSRIAPGGFIVPHTDASRWRRRWQVPIQPAGLTVVDEVAFGSVAGRAFPIEHWRPHAVWNFTDRPRVHLVIDLDEFVDREPAEFRTFPIPSQYQETVHGRS